MAYTTTVPSTPAFSSPTLPSSVSETRLRAALEHARRLTAMHGNNSIEVAIAWETVEELQTAKARRQPPRPSAFANYCAANPDALECRIYES
ncbi:MAG: Calvin cycle protein CP12 [Cyanobacteria bacterium P01_G01_bin.38]